MSGFLLGIAFFAWLPAIMFVPMPKWVAFGGLPLLLLLTAAWQSNASRVWRPVPA